MTQEFESRRARRLAEAQAQTGVANADSYIQAAPMVAEALPEATTVQAAQPQSRRELREQLRQGSSAISDEPFENSPSIGDPDFVPMFETSSGFSLDTTTNSIVLPVTPDALTGSMMIETGVTLKTGSIPLPNLNTTTGSIPLPEAAQIADDAQRLDSSTSFVSSISPVAAQDLIRQNPELGFAPVTSKGVQGQLFYALTVSIMMLTVGGLLVVAWMYGFIK